MKNSPQAVLQISQIMAADNMNSCLHSISGLVPPEALPLQLCEPFCWEGKTYISLKME